MARNYEKFFTRARDLFTAQYWYLSERYGLEELTKGAMHFDPLFVFRSGNGQDTYYDIDDPKTDIMPLLEFFRDNPQEFYTVVEEYQLAFNKMKELLSENDIKHIPQLIELATKSWVGLVAIVVIGRKNDDPGYEEIAKVAKEVRYNTDKLEYELQGDLITLIEKAYPTMKGKGDLLLIEEVISGELPNDEDLEKRSQGFIYYQGKLYTDYSLTNFQSDFGVRLFQPVVEDTDNISGQVAQKGYAVGIVRVLLTPSNMASFIEGEILVSPMTTPDFMSAIRIAKAIITDEGGVTCHAAIVARELNKPCIIGTKVATQILQDGDEVEVDADKGVITIIKKAQQN